MPPSRILLATDLGSRSDRALDRAALLAREFPAELVVAHVLEENTGADEAMASWRRPADLVEAARRQLLRDVGAVARKATILIETGEPAEAIVRAAEREHCDLIVTGVARDELLGRFRLGATVDGVLRASSVPVLVVRTRAAAPYADIVVAMDFSECSRYALQTAAAWFPDVRQTVLHACDAPLSMLSSDPGAYRRELRDAAREEGAALLRSMGRDPGTLRVEFGAPDELLREYARDEGMDLVVLGTHGRGVVFEFFIGSVAKQIVSGVHCDALLVRGPRTPAKAAD